VTGVFGQRKQGMQMECGGEFGQRKQVMQNEVRLSKRGQYDIFKSRDLQRDTTADSHKSRESPLLIYP